MLISEQARVRVKIKSRITPQHSRMRIGNSAPFPFIPHHDPLSFSSRNSHGRKGFFCVNRGVQEDDLLFRRNEYQGYNGVYEILAVFDRKGRCAGRDKGELYLTQAIPYQ